MDAGNFKNASTEKLVIDEEGMPGTKYDEKKPWRAP